MKTHIENKLDSGAFPEFNIQEYTARAVFDFFITFLHPRVNPKDKYTVYLSNNNYGFIYTHYQYSDLSVSRSPMIKELLEMFPNIDFVYDATIDIPQTIFLLRVTK